MTTIRLHRARLIGSTPRSSFQPPVQMPMIVDEISYTTDCPTHNLFGDV